MSPSSLNQNVGIWPQSSGPREQEKDQGRAEGVGGRGHAARRAGSTNPVQEAGAPFLPAASGAPAAPAAPRPGSRRGPRSSPAARGLRAGGAPWAGTGTAPGSVQAGGH